MFKKLKKVLDRKDEQDNFVLKSKASFKEFDEDAPDFLNNFETVNERIEYAINKLFSNTECTSFNDQYILYKNEDYVLSIYDVFNNADYFKKICKIDDEDTIENLDLVLDAACYVENAPEDFKAWIDMTIKYKQSDVNDRFYDNVADVCYNFEKNRRKVAKLSAKYKDAPWLRLTKKISKESSVYSYSSFLAQWATVIPMPIQKETTEWIESNVESIDLATLWKVTELVESHQEDPENSPSISDIPASWVLKL